MTEVSHAPDVSPDLTVTRPLAGRRILMIAPQPFFQPRGTPISVYHRCVALGRMGARVDLLTYPIGEDVEIEGVTIHRAAGGGLFKSIRIGPSWRKIPLDLALFFMAFRFLARNRYDLVHTHEEAGIFYALASFLFGAPHLYDMHSSLPQQFGNFQFLNVWPVVATFRLFERLTLQRSRGLITICPDLEKTVTDLAPDRPQVMIENYVDNLTAFGADPEAARRIAGTWKDAGRKTVLYAGTLEPYQGLDLLVESAPAVVARVPECRFLVVGGHPGQVDAIRAMARARGVAEHFAFTGQVPARDVAAYVDLCDVIVSPRTSGTNTPLKIYSYLRSGRPLVATRLHTHTQVLDDRIAFLADPDPSAFADGIVQALTDPRRAKSVAKAALERAEAEYSYASYLEKVKRAYEHVLGPLDGAEKA